MINIAICDDQQLIIDWLEKRIRGVFDQYQLDFKISTFKNGNLLINANKTKNFDILFLDIDMKPINGFEVASEINKTSDKKYIVFVTSKHHLMKQSFDYQPFNFICKDEYQLMNKELERICHKLIRNLKCHTLIRIVDTVEGIYNFPANDIIYLKSEKHYLNYNIKVETISLNNYRYLELKERGTIPQKETELSDYDFIKPHQRYLINMHHIIKIDKYASFILMSNGEKIPLSKSLKNTVIEKYLDFKRR